MRVAFFTETYYPTPDGVSHYLRDIKDALTAKGHDVKVFSLTGEPGEDVHIVPGFTFPFYRQYKVPINLIPFMLFRKAIKFRPDIIHIHSPFFMGSVGFLVGKKIGVPVVASFHTDFSSMQESIRMPFKERLFRLSANYNRYLYAQCDEVICPSPHATSIATSHGIKEAKEIPLFVDTERFTPGEGERDNTILFIGRLTQDKGVYHIIELAERLKSSDYRFVIGGTGPEEESLNKEVLSRDLGDKVSLLGYIKEKKKLELLRKAAVFIYPASADTFGLSVLEALACGTPAVVPEKFPLHAYSDGESGLVPVDFDRIDDVLNTIEQMLSNRKNLDKRRKSARDFAVTSFGISEHSGALLDIYGKLIEEGKKESGEEQIR